MSRYDRGIMGSDVACGTRMNFKNPQAQRDPLEFILTDTGNNSVNNLIKTYANGIPKPFVNPFLHPHDSIQI